MADDGIEFAENGTITVTIDGRAFRLRRPTVGEQLRWSEALVEIGRWQRDNTADGLLPDVSMQMASWMRDVIAALADDPTGLPEQPEDMPAWVANPMLGAEMRVAWRSLPLANGDLPSERLRRATSTP